MNTEGKIAIELQRASCGGALEQVVICSERPVLLSRLFAGKPVADVLRMVPLLFNVCGRAQFVAASRAIESASGKPVSTGIEAHRDALVALESLREHLWRSLMDWPPLLGAPARIERMAPIHQTLNTLMNKLNEDGPDEALRQTWSSLRNQIADLSDSGELGDRLFAALAKRHWQGLGSVDLHGLPSLPVADLQPLLSGEGADDFVRQPLWQNRSWETGPLQRQQHRAEVRECIAQYGAGLQARFVARLLEIKVLLETVDRGLEGESSPACPAGKGIAQLETARGRLVHAVDLDGDKVRRFRILAPTEWNFHPRGAAATALSGLSEADDAGLLDQARLLIHSIDPCVGFDLRVSRHA